MTNPVEIPPRGFDDLSIDEQIEYVQRLWDHIAEHPERVPVPEWHVEELRRRQDAARNSPDAGSTWEAVRDGILGRLPRQE